MQSAAAATPPPFNTRQTCLEGLSRHKWTSLQCIYGLAEAKPTAGTADGGSLNDTIGERIRQDLLHSGHAHYTNSICWVE